MLCRTILVVIDILFDEFEFYEFLVSKNTIFQPAWKPQRGLSSMLGTIQLISISSLFLHLQESLNNPKKRHCSSGSFHNPFFRGSSLTTTCQMIWKVCFNTNCAVTLLALVDSSLTPRQPQKNSSCRYSMSKAVTQCHSRARGRCSAYIGRRSSTPSNPGASRVGNLSGWLWIILKLTKKCGNAIVWSLYNDVYKNMLHQRRAAGKAGAAAHLNRGHGNHTEATEIIFSLTWSKNKHPKWFSTIEQLLNLSRWRQHRGIDCQNSRQ